MTRVPEPEDSGRSCKGGVRLSVTATSVLIACSADWAGVARLPSMLAAEGFSVHLMDPGKTQASRSRWVETRVAVSGGTSAIAERLVQEGPRYDRVIVCDEFLLASLLVLEDSRVADLLPAEPAVLGRVIDKTRFPDLARSMAVRVPSSSRVVSEAELRLEAAKIGGVVAVKGTVGAGGAVVRRAPDVEMAAAYAQELGYPVLVEEWVEGRVCLVPCLFERGALVAATAAEKRRTVRRFGPSAVNGFMPVDSVLTELIGRIGRSFGLHGFASIDLIYPDDDGGPTVIEVNPRPVPQVHLGRVSGVNMARELKRVAEGRFDGQPALGRESGTAIMFPQELTRSRLEHGSVSGLVRWARTPGAFEDVPWDDPRLLIRQLVR